MAILRVRKGSQVGRVYQVFSSKLPTVIGRDAHADVALEDDRASRRHARVLELYGAWFVQDLGSSNGTLVDGKRVEKAALVDGQSLQVGNTLLSFHERELPEALYPEIYGAKILETLAEEGAVLVHRAYQAALDREVRIDCAPFRQRSSPRFEARLRAAVEDARRVRHPAVDPLVHADLESDKGAYVVLRWRGESNLESSLASVLGSPLAERLRLFRGLVEAACARAAFESLRAPLSLRQFRVSVQDDGRAVVSAAALEVPALATATTASTCHLPQYVDYVSPEVVRDEEVESAGAWSSVAYSLGALGYHLLTGRTPMGDGPVRKRLENHATLPPAPPQLLCAEIPAPVSDLILAMLRKDAAERPGDSETILAALNDAEGETTAAATREAAPPARPTPGAQRPAASAGLAPASTSPSGDRAAPRVSRPARASGSANAARTQTPAHRGVPAAPAASGDRLQLFLSLPLWAVFWTALFFGGRLLAKVLFREFLG